MLQKITSDNNRLMNLNYSDYEYEDKSLSHQLIADIKARLQLDRPLIYDNLTTINRIECFISYHIFGVWDFYKILGSLQNKLSVDVLNKSQQYPEALRQLLDKVVFALPSELYPYGQPNEDFARYLRAVAEIDIDPDCYLWYFLEAPNNLDLLKPGIKELVEFNSNIARSGTISEQLAVWLFGREKLDSRVFTSIIKVVEQANQECSTLINYRDELRQNNFDRDRLSSTAFPLLDCCCQDRAEKVRALQAGLEALRLREQLWNYALTEIGKLNPEH